MAITLSHRLLCIYTVQVHPTFNSQFPTRNSNLSFPRRRNVSKPKSSPRRNTGTSPENKIPSQQLPSKNSPEEFGAEESDASLHSSLSGAFWLVLLRRFREGIKFDELGLDILKIALPAALALAADPFASLVDTAFVGHLGSVELAAVGVSVSVFNLMSKLFNVPLLNITTSFVAEEQAQMSKGDQLSQTDDGCIDSQSKKLLPSVPTSLALAAAVGLVEAVALSLGSSIFIDIMGIPTDSPMRAPAEQFLAFRGFGAPAVVIALAAQGTFRGLMDTKTPLYAIGAGSFLNAILDPILIFYFGLGTGGAAVAIVISEYLIAFILLWKLSSKVLLIPSNFEGGKIISYLESGGLLIGRTLAVYITITLATSMAAREGPTHMAGHQICLQVWLAVSLLTDSLALAGQALLASSYSQGNYEQAQKVLYRVLQLGLATGMALSMVLFFGFRAFSSLFSTDLEVLEIAWSGILFVAGSQPVNALAFVLDGLYYGVSDFGYAAYSTVLAGLISSAFLVVAASSQGLAGVWAGLFLFMTLRVLAGIWRLGTKSGPWNMIWYKSEQETE